ncbi:prolyl oligopeptidase family serine peptidase [Bdellovibrio sp. HCB2-146]|uniref:extracellular medium-chain-length polyhydroxyalkanoate depolymerase n=1 Tax=Bdellovibrio sp. HCB2-146 TaxID=3394362 RepID=UPI0039BC8A61
MKELIVFLLLMFAMINAAEAQEGRSGCVMDTGLLDRIECPYSVVEVQGPIFKRKVKYGIPQGRAPKGGWPTVVLYQGTFFPVEFSRRQMMPFGGFNEIRLIQNLMDNGFAVIAPPATEKLAWMTNIIGMDYDTSEDFYFIQELLRAMNAGEFGKLNMNQLFATGISSGGYHTSRMAVSFPGVFKALAIESASYATCGGPMCFVPDALPANHPPTLFLHGMLDHVVPITTMYSYLHRLEDEGVETKVLVDTFARHQWLDEAPEEITQWFLQHLR